MNLTAIQNQARYARDLITGRIQLPPGSRSIVLYETLTSMTDAVDYLLADKTVSPSMDPADRARVQFSIRSALDYEVAGTWWVRICPAWLHPWAVRRLARKVKKKHDRYVLQAVLYAQAVTSLSLSLSLTEGQHLFR